MDSLTKLFVYAFLLSSLRFSSPLDIISPGQLVRDGDTIISASQSFELGFFSPGGSARRYLGIWYKKVSEGTIVWVANREAPLLDRSGVLNINDQGILVLVNATNHAVWSSNGTRTGKNPTAQLLESGNLVVKDGNDSSNSESYLWQSFDYPCDTFLPEMKLGINFVTGIDTSISSWKNLDDPARGDYVFGIDPRGFPQLVVKKKGALEFRLGPWNGIRIVGAPRQRTNPVYTFDFVLSNKEVYYIFKLQNSSIPSRITVNASGLVERVIWIEKTRSWALYYAVGEDQCDNYALCGVYAICNINNYPVCSCLDGFDPQSTRDWGLQEWTGGCARKASLSCDRGEGFVKYEGLKLPDTSSSWFDKNMSLNECEQMCLKNCSCVAYTNSNISGRGSGCLLWFDELIDMREYADTGQDIYIRMAASYLEHIKRKRKSRERKRVAVIVCSTIIATGILVLAWILYVRNRGFRNQEKIKNLIEMYYNKQSKEEDLDLPMIALTTIVKATRNFSSNNLLGKGGFGPVYKGTLPDGQEIAVKRLSMDNGQGVEQFINEVVLIAKLQHRNLVKLLGCCIEENERLLIYEYMPNKSLNYFIFDRSNSRTLDWWTRINIIDGIARGLLYLHQDSRLRIIHRDLKASNILLDDNMNPKISDFGMARIFGGNQTEENTKRVVGTYGYMAPEYAGDGLFSLKSDVFSYGVLILEIVSGKRNRGFQCDDHEHNLLGHAWKLWMEERTLEIIDNTLGHSCSLSEIIRRIHVGLLCVQQRPDDRPNMSNVVVMLGGESSLPPPKQPGFFTESSKPGTTSSSGIYKSTSTNEITMTLLDAR